MMGAMMGAAASGSSSARTFLGLRGDDPRRHLLALVVVMICGALLWTSERDRSLTADEPLHLVRGHSLWWTHQSRLSYAHPPLANAITSLPYAGRGSEAWGEGKTPAGAPRPPTKAETRAQLDPTSTNAEALPQLPGWEAAQPLDLASAYFRHDFGRAKAELRGARRMMMLWTLALIAFLYLWVERRWGYAAGLIAASLAAVHPTLLAHGRLVTTDMPLAATTFVSLAALIAWIERPGWARVAGFGLATTAMVLSKHSGLAYVVVMSLILLAAAGLGRGGFGEGPRWRALGLCAVQLTLVAVVMIFMIDAAYLFDRVGLSVAEILAEPEPRNWISKRHDYHLLADSPVAKLPSGLRLPFPYTWLVGLATVSDQNAVGHGRYFFGIRPAAGHPLYFPVMLFAKTPTGVLALLGLGLGLVVGRARAGQGPSLATSVLLIFAGLTLASACASNINIGVRHTLPLMPILAVFAGRSAGLLVDPAPKPEPGSGADPDSPEAAGPGSGLGSGPGSGKIEAALAGRRGRALVLASVLGSAAGAAWTFPTYLGDFNLLVGGPTGGHVISVIGEDWGQDLGDLADLAQAEGWERVAYHTTFPLRREELESRGLEVTRFGCSKAPPGDAPSVVHLSDWVRRPKCFAWLRERSPAHVVNHHLLVFTAVPSEE